MYNKLKVKVIKYYGADRFELKLAVSWTIIDAKGLLDIIIRIKISLTLPSSIQFRISNSLVKVLIGRDSQRSVIPILNPQDATLDLLHINYPIF